MSARKTATDVTATAMATRITTRMAATSNVTATAVAAVLGPSRGCSKQKRQAEYCNRNLDTSDRCVHGRTTSPTGPV